MIGKLLFAIVFALGLEARLYFLHIPKTGGTTLRYLLEQQVNPEELYPYRNYMVAKGPISHNLVSGHFSYWFCKEQDECFDEAFKITILREPVERYLSFLRAKKGSDEKIHSLEEVFYYHRNPRHAYRYGLMENSLCKHLAADPNLSGTELLESAKATLQQLDCVLFFDRYAEEVVALFQRLGIDLDEREIPHLNRAEQEPVSEQLLEEIRKLNELDIQLYEYAKTDLMPKTNTYRLKKPHFSSIKYPYF